MSEVDNVALGALGALLLFTTKPTDRALTGWMGSSLLFCPRLEWQQRSAAQYITRGMTEQGEQEGLS